MRNKKVYKEKPKMGRIPTAPPTSYHRDKKKYHRKDKYPKKGE